MTQPNLLELAKQGDPYAIATLMNLTLEPQGVIVKAVLEDHCLHVFLTSARTLNPATLTRFTQRGVSSLGSQAIQTVRVYGQKVGVDRPIWVEGFAINPTDASTAPINATPDTAQPQLDRFAQLMPSWVGRWHLLRPQLQAHVDHGMTASRQWVSQLSLPESWLPANVRSSNYLVASTVVTVLAFVTGAVLAIIANSYTAGSSEQQTKTRTNAAQTALALKSEAERVREQQQAAAQHYLEMMNKAQQAFYLKNGHFAPTLEELERSAAAPIISNSNYTYKLTAQNKTQTQLTAIPKADGLKSYTAVVSVAANSSKVLTAICESPQAAKVPPLVFQAAGGAIQCPSEPADAS